MDLQQQDGTRVGTAAKTIAAATTGTVAVVVVVVAVAATAGVQVNSDLPPWAMRLNHDVVGDQ